MKTGAKAWTYTGANGGNAWISSTLLPTDESDYRSYVDLPTPITDFKYGYMMLGPYRNYEANYMSAISD